MQRAMRSAVRAFITKSNGKGAPFGQWRSFSDVSSAVKAGDIGEVSGVPDEHLQRRVIIYSPARSASQQGSGKTGKWKINFISTQKWENPLMGWTSTGDPYAHLGDAALTFDNKESAIRFANKYGWDYTVRDPHHPIIKPKAYADNFKFKGPVNAEEGTY